MRENINKVSQRGERLDALQDKTDNLAVSAQGFRRGANRVRKQMWWKDMKMRMCLIAGVVILLIIIIVPVGKCGPVLRPPVTSHEANMHLRSGHIDEINLPSLAASLDRPFLSRGLDLFSSISVPSTTSSRTKTNFGSCTNLGGARTEQDVGTRIGKGRSGGKERWKMIA